MLNACSILNSYICLKEIEGLFTATDTLTSEGLVCASSPLETVPKMLISKYIENHMEVELLSSRIYTHILERPDICPGWGIPLYPKGSKMLLHKEGKNTQINLASIESNLSKADFLHAALCHKNGRDVGPFEIAFV